MIQTKAVKAVDDEGWDDDIDRLGDIENMCEQIAHHTGIEILDGAGQVFFIGTLWGALEALERA